MTTKICHTCEEDLPRAMFWDHPGASDGKQSSCKSCCADAQRNRRTGRKMRGNASEISSLLGQWGRAGVS